MRSCMFFSTVDALIYIYYCLLVSATLHRVSLRGGCSSCLSPAKTGTIGSSPIIIYFYKVYLNIFNVCFFWLLSHVRSGHLLEDSVIESLFEADCLQRHQRGFRSCQRIFPVVPMQYELIIFFHLVHQSCHQSPILSPGYYFTPLFFR